MILKRPLTLAIVSLALLGLFPLSAAMAEQREFRWKIATLAPKNVGWAQQVNSLVLPWISHATNDALKLKIYWGGVMGNDQEYLQKMKIGQLQGAGVSGMGANMACPEFSILGLPFLFKSYDEVDYIRRLMFSTFDYYFSSHGYKMLMWIDQDFDECFSTKYPMTSLDDFKKCRFQNWYGPVEAATVQALGASPIVTTVIEGHSAFRSGVIDTAFGPAVYYAGSQLFTAMRYVNPMKIRYAPGIILVVKKEWEALPEDLQDNLEAGRDRVQAAFVKGTRDENQKTLEGMIKYGIKLTELSPSVRAEFVKRTRPVWDQFAGQLYPKHLLDEVLRYLDGLRAGKPIKAPRFKAPQAAAPKPAAGEPSARASQPAAAGKSADSSAGLSGWERRKLEVRKVQEKLSAMGYYKGEIDGVFGPMTQQAILDYQDAKGLFENGAIDRRLLRSLGISD